jgi:hypothetical protein
MAVADPVTVAAAGVTACVAVIDSPALAGSIVAGDAVGDATVGASVTARVPVVSVATTVAGSVASVAGSVGAGVTSSTCGRVALASTADAGVSAFGVVERFWEAVPEPGTAASSVGVCAS